MNGEGRMGNAACGPVTTEGMWHVTQALSCISLSWLLGLEYAPVSEGIHSQLPQFYFISKERNNWTLLKLLRASHS